MLVAGACDAREIEIRRKEHNDIVAVAPGNRDRRIGKGQGFDNGGETIALDGVIAPIVDDREGCIGAWGKDRSGNFTDRQRRIVDGDAAGGNHLVGGIVGDFDLECRPVVQSEIAVDGQCPD